LLRIQSSCPKQFFFVLTKNIIENKKKRMFPVLVTIAKLEHDYIEEFVRYHLALGFECIYLYDNENVPTYHNLLEGFNEKVRVIHIPFNNYNKPVQYLALDHFVANYLFRTPITHVAHIDVDEFIALKKHASIKDFIEEFIVGDCQGVGMNWRFFGSSNRTEKTAEPITSRFTMCSESGNQHIKTLFKKDAFSRFNTCHDVVLKHGHIKATNGSVIEGPFNHAIDLTVVQLNHYKCKTLPEFRYIRTRHRADKLETIQEDVDSNFRLYDINDVEDLTAMHFYQTHCFD